MLERLCEVVNFVRVSVQVVEFFRWLALPEFALSFIQLPGVEHLFPDTRRRRLKHVLDVLPVNLVRHVLTQIDIPPVGHRTQQVITFVHAASETVDKRLRASVVLPGKRVSLHPCWRFLPDQAEQCWSEVDERSQTIRCAARDVLFRSEMRELLGDVNDQWNIQT